MPADTITVAVLAGLVIGLALGALGGGGSILAVPVLAFLLGQSAVQATTGSLAVVGLASSVSAYAAWRAGRVLLWRGIGFGLAATGGAAAGAVASSRVPEPVLLVSFAGLVAVVATLMIARQVRDRRSLDPDLDPRQVGVVRSDVPARARFDDPLVRFRPTFLCRCPAALKVLATATAVGLTTGFLGVGGGFLVVPALLLALALPMEHAVGTSLVVITITSAAALAVRAGTGAAPEWALVAVLATASVAGGWLGTRLAGRVAPARLQSAFAGLLVVVAAATAWQAVPALT